MTFPKQTVIAFFLFFTALGCTNSARDEKPVAAKKNPPTPLPQAAEPKAAPPELISEEAKKTFNDFFTEKQTKNRKFRGPSNQLYRHFVFLPDGKHLVTSAAFGVLLWDLEASKIIRIMENSLNCGALAVSDDAKWVLSAKDFREMIGIWDLSTGKTVCELIEHSNGMALDIAISADKNFVLVGTGTYNPSADPGKRYDNLHLWDISKRDIVQRLFGHDKGGVTSLAFSRDGKLAVSTSFNNREEVQQVILWNLQDGSKLRQFEYANKLEDRQDTVEFSGDEKRVLALGKVCRAWDIATGKLVQVSEKLGKFGSPLAFSPDRRFYITQEIRNEDVLAFEPLNYWDMSSGQMLRQLELPKERSFTRVVFSPDGKKIGVGGNSSNHLQIWDLETGKLWRDLKLPTEITSRFLRS